MSTLLPHLTVGGLETFRLALAAGSIVVLLLALAGLVAGAVVAGAALVPVLYAVYLYEVRIRRVIPVGLVVLAAAGGALLGVGVMFVARALTPGAPSLDLGGSGSWVLAAVTPALIAELVKPIPVLVGGRRTLLGVPDAVALGIASGVGFALGETMVRYGGTLTELQTSARPADWIVPLLILAVVRPILHGATTGVVVALFARPTGLAPWTALLAIATVLLAPAFAVVDAATAASGSGPVVRLLADSGVAVLGVLALRVVLQHRLVREATSVELAIGTCPGCDRRLLLGAFCPECGMAIAASPRTAS